MDAPLQWPIWIGPAQQSDARSLCYPNPCSLCWPHVPGAVCQGEKHTTFENITLRNIVINRPKQSPGVLLAHQDYPMKNIVFDHVQVLPWGSLVDNNDESFPLLRPFDRFALTNNVAADRHVTTLRFLMGITSVASVAGLYKLYTKSSVAQLQTAGAIMLALVGVGLAIVAPTAIRVERYDEYFECSNIQGGIATGNTWPVPSCFLDNSTIDSNAVQYYSTPPWVVSYLSISLFCVTSLSAGVYALHRCMSSKQTTNIEEEEGMYVHMGHIPSPALTVEVTMQNKVGLRNSKQQSSTTGLPHTGEGTPAQLI
eukprot:13784320-Ditylum_brightwellii.AAC.1